MNTVVFYVAATAMIAVALCLIVVPLLRRRSGHAPTRGMLAMAIGAVVILPAAAVGLYASIGTPAALDAKVTVASTSPEDAAEAKRQSDIAAYMHKAQAYEAAHYATDAADAYRQVLALDPDQTAAMVGLVEAGMSQHPDYAIDAPSRELLRQAIALEPDNQRALWLLGIGAFQQDDFPLASQTWRHLLSLLDAGSPLSRNVAEKIAVADARANAHASVDTPTR